MPGAQDRKPWHENNGKDCQAEAHSFLKRTMWKLLKARRPSVFAGLKHVGIDTNQHSKLVDSLSPFDSKIIMRVCGGWGCFDQSSQAPYHIDHVVSSECECGHASHGLIFRSLY